MPQFIIDNETVLYRNPYPAFTVTVTHSEETPVRTETRIIPKGESLWERKGKDWVRVS